MSKKIAALLILLVLSIIFTINYTYNFLSTKHNVEITKKEAIEICDGKKLYCHYAYDIKNLDDNQKIVMDTRYKNNLVNVAEFIGFLVLIFVMLLYFYKREKESEDIGLKWYDFFLFATLANFKIINFCLINFKISIIHLCILAIVFCYISFFLLYFIFKLLFRNRCKAIVFSVFVLGILILGTKITYYFNTIGSLEYTSMSLIVLLHSAISILFLLYIFSKDLFKIIKTFAIIFLTLNILNFSYLYTKKIVQSMKNNKNSEINTLKLKKGFDKNIYIIVLDMYSGYEILEHLGYKNDKFINELENRGFLVFKNIDSNYTKTKFSISSILNFEYLQDTKFNLFSDSIDKSLIFESVKNAGYSVYYLNSYSCELKLKKENYKHLADIENMTYITANEFMKKIVRDTYFENYSTLIDKCIVNSEHNNIIDFLDYSFSNKDKKLVFMHLLMPHFPYLFDENGKRLENVDNIKIDTGIYKINEKSYIEYLKYTNKKITEITDIILKNDKNPLIILTGDHGAKMFVSEINHEKLYNDTIIKNEIALKSFFNTFLAYYNPNMNKENYNNTKTLLSFFRKFANEIFDTKFDINKNRKFYNYYDNTGDLIKECKYTEVFK